MRMKEGFVQDDYSNDFNHKRSQVLEKRILKYKNGKTKMLN